MNAAERAAIALTGMTHTYPTPAAVRAWMQQRQVERAPVPTPEQIRRELSWHMLPNNRAVECAR